MAGKNSEKVNISDDELYRAYLSGDGAAGDELMLRHSGAVTAYIDAFIHNAQDAEELMLDCFAVILVDKPDISEGNFRAYLFKVARNKANHLWRLRFRRSEFDLDEETAETVPDTKATPEESAMKTEQNMALHRCLNRIAPQYREALWLFYFCDMSYAQIAKVMKCSTKRIEDLLRNGKARMRTEMEKEGIIHADI